MSDAFREIGVFEYYRRQREAFKQGHLWQEWAARYPDIFDEEDCRLAESQGPDGYHFNEWLAAVLLYETYGFLSLIEKYEERSHPRKREIFTAIAPQAVLDAVFDYTTFRRTQAPDLFVYAPDKSEWFFCEVKGKGDRFSLLQKAYFEHLAAVSGQSIGLIRLREAKVP